MTQNDHIDQRRLTDEEIARILERLIPTSVPTAGFQSATVKSDVDFDGESIIRVTAYFKRRPPGKPDALMNSVHTIHDALAARGEDRFVFLTTDVEEERQPELEIEEEEVG